MARENKELDASTEEKIITAAKTIFTKKGFAAAKMRDIAAEADISLSLINYYFRSKEKLFGVIVAENIDRLFDKIGPVLNNERSTLNEKVSSIAEHYIDLLLENPDFPRFIVNEIMSGSNKNHVIASKKELIQKSHFAKQVFMLQVSGKIKYNPLQILMNLIGMIVFPFLGRNLIESIGVEKEAFRQMMKERKKLIPVWIEAIISCK